MTGRFGLTRYRSTRRIRSVSLECGQSATAQLQEAQNQLVTIWQSATAKFNPQLQVPPDKLLNRLSFTHLAQLLPLKDPLHRTFYEIECIKGTWSVSELKRQIGSLYFERSGMSKNPENLYQLLNNEEKENENDLLVFLFGCRCCGIICPLPSLPLLNYCALIPSNCFLSSSLAP